MADDTQVRDLTRQLLIALGIQTRGNMQIALHLDSNGVVGQVELKVFRKLKAASEPLARAS